MKSSEEEKDTITQNKYLHINSKSKKGRSALDNFIKAGAFIAGLSASVSGFAASVTPYSFAGTPTTADVKFVCGWPDVFQGEPVRLDVTKPQNGTDQSFSTQDNIFQVSLDIANKSVDFTDESPVNGPLGDKNPNQHQQVYDIRGIEGVVVQSGSSANIYCYINKENDTNLTVALGNSINSISIFWLLGPCGLDEDNITSVCSSYGNADQLLISYPLIHFGNTQQGVASINTCGCNNQVPRYCDPSLSPGDIGACNPYDDSDGIMSGNQTGSVSTVGPKSCLIYSSGKWISTC